MAEDQYRWMAEAGKQASKKVQVPGVAEVLGHLAVAESIHRLAAAIEASNRNR
ncbi:MAG: hypothetical protein R2823_02900 [Acidimicrobiia bacterium]